MDLLQDAKRFYIKSCAACGVQMSRKKLSEAKRENWLFCSRTCKCSTNNRNRVKVEERRCRYCESIFTTKTTDKRKNKKQFCTQVCSGKFRNKYANPSKTIQGRKKLSIAAKLHGTAQMRTPEAREKMSKTISGKGHWNWQGGITPENKRRRVLKEYKLWRKAVFERDTYTCQICFVRGTALQADHIKAWARYPDLRLELSNGRTLCVPCHRKTDTYGVKSSSKR